MRIFTHTLLLLLFATCAPPEQDKILIEQNTPVLALSRTFRGNTLTITTAGVPPLVVSLHKEGKQVFHDFLEHSGKLDIDILPFRANHGAYEVRVQDMTDRDTSITIRIDKYAPRQKRIAGRKKGSSKKYVPLYKAEYVKGEKIGGIEKETFYCPACDEYIALYYGTRAARTAYVHKEFPGIRNTVLHLAGRQFCELKCKKRLGR